MLANKGKDVRFWVQGVPIQHSAFLSESGTDFSGRDRHGILTTGPRFFSLEPSLNFKQDSCEIPYILKAFSVAKPGIEPVAINTLYTVSSPHLNACPLFYSVKLIKELENLRNQFTQELERLIKKHVQELEKESKQAQSDEKKYYRHITQQQDQEIKEFLSDKKKQYKQKKDQLKEVKFTFFSNLKDFKPSIIDLIF